jgi:prepilin-type N-terminal cleavage/methylation domain-containing protein
MKTKRFFTLIEVMIALAILALVAAPLSWKIFSMVERGRFQSDQRKIESLLRQGRSLALNTKADWVLELQKSRRGWETRLRCVEVPSQGDFRASLGPCKIVSNGKEVAHIAFTFYSSGAFKPFATLMLISPAGEKEWNLPTLFNLEEGEMTPVVARR